MDSTYYSCDLVLNMEDQKGHLITLRSVLAAAHWKHFPNESKFGHLNARFNNFLLSFSRFYQIIQLPPSVQSALHCFLHSMSTL